MRFPAYLQDIGVLIKKSSLYLNPFTAGGRHPSLLWIPRLFTRFDCVFSTVVCVLFRRSVIQMIRIHALVISALVQCPILRHLSIRKEVRHTVSGMLSAVKPEQPIRKVLTRRVLPLPAFLHI